MGKVELELTNQITGGEGFPSKEQETIEKSFKIV